MDLITYALEYVKKKICWNLVFMVLSQNSKKMDCNFLYNSFKSNVILKIVI